MMSGIISNVQWGQVKSLYNSDSDWVYTNYDGERGDSGAPVGKVPGGTFNIYGIHKGGSPYGSARVPYDTLESYLNLD